MASAASVPPEIAGYRLIRPLGRGGMATAWLAQQLSLGREVALKVLDPGLARDPGFVARFQREGQVLASMHHRHIVAVHDVGLSGDTPYLAMEYLRRGSVAELCGRADVATTLRCVREIALALEHAHGKGVVHRDVKPENIFQHDDGSFLLGDFGIARQLDTATALGAAGQALGTPHYMSPERWRNEAFDGRADLYSLGGVLYALATGKPPYEGEDAFAIGMQHMSAPIPLLPPSHAVLQGLLARLMAKDPAQRAPDARAVAEHAGMLERELSAGADTPPRAALRHDTQQLLREWPFGGGKALLDRPRPWWRRPVAALGVLLGAAGALALLAFALLPRLKPAAPRAASAIEAPMSIAVMPFAVAGDDAALAALGVVISDDVANQLARDAAFRVAARVSTAELHARDTAPGEAAARLGVGHVLVGEVSRRGTAIVVDARLFDDTGAVTLRQRFEAPASELWRLERDLAAGVAAALASGRGPATTPAAPRARPSAYVAYLRGRQKMVGSPSEIALEDAIAAFTEAIAADPGFVSARAWLCNAETQRFTRRREAAAAARAQQACNEAELAAPDLPELLLAQGDLKRALGEPALALSYYERAAGDPVLRADALLGLARSSGAMGREADAERWFREARALQPGNWRIYFETGNFLVHRSRFREAIENYRTALSLSPENAARINNNLGAAYQASDDFENALRAFEASLAVERNASALSNVGTVRFYLGDYAGAAASYREALALAAADYRLYGNLADCLSMIDGQRREAQAMYAEAARRAQSYLGAKRDSIEAAADLAWYSVNLGNTAVARSMLDVADARKIVDGDVAYSLALTSARLGDRDRMTFWRTRAAELGYSQRILQSTALLAVAQ